MTTGVLARRARRQLYDILDHLERVAGAAVATQYAHRFAQALERLEAFPLSGSRRDELGAHVRVVFVAPYIVFYDYAKEQDIVQVTAIRHFRRLTTSSDIK